MKSIPNPPRVAIAGATGAVGQEFLKLLAQRRFPMASLKLLASERSKGRVLLCGERAYTCEVLGPDSFNDVDLAFFSAGGAFSKEFAPVAAKAGAVVVDNSSAFRYDDAVPLVIPEINPDDAFTHQGIIANPNCTTIVALMALAPLHRAFGLKRVVTSSYQAISGAGAAAMQELEDQARAWAAGEPIKVERQLHQILFNVYPHIDAFQPNGYTKEEMKQAWEARKILHLPSLRSSATCVRVPVLRSHSVAINAEFDQPVTAEAAREVLLGAAGVEVVDDPAANRYPMPLHQSGRDEVAVGRIRRDESCDNGLCLWTVGDQIGKGAALNAVQIAELLLKGPQA